ncbi:Predicted PurR-regulated permease PerM [Parasphingorhabdus marina DSM 22363]|uniref:Predicted PurR-regulated permease PerM n=1 Tax=Parasphingorhabdus marina DSM 22363 TaxID=1123272 RepID=A0A1N6DG03_9SPHN|nr:AI-2E family transporter [Parasphingorhabdus marina]SIN69739.1 Predicted PurR-regulated permease PerM [Parasphingorhabdus marina DSM 22363]
MDQNAASRVETGFLILLVALVTAAFAWLIEPFFGAIIWAVVITVLFLPVFDWLVRILKGRTSSAALLTLLLIISLVIVPAIILGFVLLREASDIYVRIQSGEIDFRDVFAAFEGTLPLWVQDRMESYGIGNFAAVREKIEAFIASSFESVIGQLINIGQSAFSFFLALGVMLYLTFYLLRDGRTLVSHVERAIPMQRHQRDILFGKFVTVIQATIKGSIIVAILQGTIGGVIFWMLDIRGALLWGVSMGILSLLPAIGTGLVWVPVAIYLIVTGAVWQGVVLVFCGLFIIGMVDNILRPILVGRDTRIPDYVILISTFGGLQLLGFNGIVIGPLLAALFLALWDIFAQTRREPEIATMN